MNKTNLLLSAFILSVVFLLGCSSPEVCECGNGPSSSSKPSSNSGGGSSSSGGGTIEDQLLTRKPITISSGKSYADIDGEPVAYTKEDALNNLEKIDLIAYCGTDEGYCKNDKIYRPYEIDLFLNPTFVGSYVNFYEIPQDQSGIFRTATRYSQIVGTLQSLSKGGYLSGPGEEEISIEKDKVFFVATSEDKWLIVIIKAIGNQSVDLEILLIPGN
ncbi:MAG: hypothetical protein LBC87_09040 [Fibromonadaceae bacterium]|jgi:hypothetical protein|nr:hypothetical protein [Fibromonadaceae bacterium]